MRHFCRKKAAFLKFFVLHFDFDFAFNIFFELWLDLDRVLENHTEPESRKYGRGSPTTSHSLVLSAQ